MPTSAQPRLVYEPTATDPDHTIRTYNDSSAHGSSLPGSSSAGVSGLPQTSTNEKAPTTNVDWHIDRRSPAKMIALFIIGTALALGRRFYYETLNGTEVMPTKSNWTLQGIKSGQEWKIRYGTAFAFMTKTAFAAAIAFAYKEHIWVTARQKALSVSGLDAMFAAVSDIFSFLDFDFISHVKLASFLALLTW